MGVHLGPPHHTGLQPAESMASPMPTAMGRDQQPQPGPCGCHVLPQWVTTWLGHCQRGWQGSRVLPRATTTCHPLVQPLCMQRGDGHGGCCTGGLGPPAM